MATSQFHPTRRGVVWRWVRPAPKVSEPTTATDRDRQARKAAGDRDRGRAGPPFECQACAGDRGRREARARGEIRELGALHAHFSIAPHREPRGRHRGDRHDEQERQQRADGQRRAVDGNSASGSMLRARPMGISGDAAIANTTATAAAPRPTVAPRNDANATRSRVVMPSAESTRVVVGFDVRLAYEDLTEHCQCRERRQRRENLERHLVRPYRAFDRGRRVGLRQRNDGSRSRPRALACATPRSRSPAGVASNT